MSQADGNYTSFIIPVLALYSNRIARCRSEQFSQKNAVPPQSLAFAFTTRDSAVRGSVLRRTTESGGGPSRDRHPHSARDTEPSNEGFRGVELKDHPLWDMERQDPMPRPRDGLRRPRARRSTARMLSSNCSGFEQRRSHC